MRSVCTSECVFFSFEAPSGFDFLDIINYKGPKKQKHANFPFVSQTLAESLLLALPLQM